MSDCCSFDPLAVLPSATTRAGSAAICPLCGAKGKSVKSITLESLLKPEALSRFDGGVHHFCSSPGCDVVYFSGQGIAPFLKGDLTVRVGIKEDTAPRHICYCFNHTIEEIEQQLPCSGKITVLEDIKTRMKIACWCETKSPQGSCCLATVTKCMQAVIADQGRATAAVPVHVGLVKDCCASPKLAVVWAGNDGQQTRTKAVQAAFEKNGLTATELDGEARDTGLKSFLSADPWYRGAEVDNLSNQEAAIIATRLVRRVQAKVEVSAETAKTLETGLTQAIMKAYKDGFVGQADKQPAAVASLFGASLVVAEDAKVLTASDRISPFNVPVACPSGSWVITASAPGDKSSQHGD